MDGLLTDNELDDAQLSVCSMASPLQMRTWPVVAVPRGKNHPPSLATGEDEARVCKGRRLEALLSSTVLCRLLSPIEAKLFRQTSECLVLSPSSKTHFCYWENT